MNEEDFIDAIMKDCLERGRLLDCGWQTFRLMIVDPLAPPTHVEEMLRVTFMAGAQHLWACAHTILEEGTPVDQAAWYVLLCEELEAFYTDMMNRVKGADSKGADSDAMESEARERVYQEGEEPKGETSMG